MNNLKRRNVPPPITFSAKQSDQDLGEDALPTSPLIPSIHSPSSSPETFNEYSSHLNEVNEAVDEYSHLTAIISRLYSILKDPRWQKIIAWSENGTSFVIHDAASCGFRQYMGQQPEFTAKTACKEWRISRTNFAKSHSYQDEIKNNEESTESSIDNDYDPLLQLAEMEVAQKTMLKQMKALQSNMNTVMSELADIDQMHGKSQEILNAIAGRLCTACNRGNRS